MRSELREYMLIRNWLCLLWVCACFSQCLISVVTPAQFVLMQLFYLQIAFKSSLQFCYRSTLINQHMHVLYMYLFRFIYNWSGKL